MEIDTRKNEDTMKFDEITVMILYQKLSKKGEITIEL